MDLRRRKPVNYSDNKQNKTPKKKSTSKQTQSSQKKQVQKSEQKNSNQKSSSKKNNQQNKKEQENEEEDNNKEDEGKLILSIKKRKGQIVKDVKEQEEQSTSNKKQKNNNGSGVKIKKKIVISQEDSNKDEEKEENKGIEEEEKVSEQQQNDQEVKDNKDNNENVNKQNQTNDKNQDIQIDTSKFVQKSSKVYSEKYSEIDDSTKLGEGNEGSVYKVHLLENPKIVKAMKILNKEKLPLLYKEKFVREIELLSQLDNPKIIKIYEYFETEDNYMLITDFFKGKDLFDVLMTKDEFTEEEVASIMKQIFSALIYIHSNNIVHRDVKLDNVIVEFEEDNQDMYIRLIDFGICGKLDGEKKLTQTVGTPSNCAPEILLGQEYDEKCDLWSAGCLLYLLLAQEHPFQASSDERTFERIKQGKYNLNTPELKQISPEGVDLIKQLLTFDPQERISAEKAYNHQWIKDHTNNNSQIISSQKKKINLERLKSYNVNQKLQQTVFGFIASHMISDKEKQDLRKTFESIDENGDGKLSREEIFKSFEQLYGKEQAEQEVQHIFSNIDRDNNGYIDYNEFLSAAMDKRDKFTKNKLRKAFELFDKDGDGEITIEELKEVFCSNNQDDEVQNKQNKSLLKIIQDVDEDKNGNISFEEFEAFILKAVSGEEIISATQD